MIRISTVNDFAMDITISEEWKWIPSYEEIMELAESGIHKNYLYGGWKSKYAFGEWYAREIEGISDDIIDFIDTGSLADWVIANNEDILMEMESGAIIQLDCGLHKD